MTNKSISFVLRPSTDLIRVLLGCQKWGRKKKKGTEPALTVKTFIKRHRTSTYSQNLHFLGVSSALFWATVKVYSPPAAILHVPEESSTAEGESLHDSMCPSYLCPPTVIQVQHQCPSDLPEVDTDGSLSQRETLLSGDPYKMSHLYELQKYQGTMSSKPFAKDVG